MTTRRKYGVALIILTFTGLIVILPLATYSSFKYVLYLWGTIIGCVLWAALITYLMDGE